MNTKMTALFGIVCIIGSSFFVVASDTEDKKEIADLLSTRIVAERDASQIEQALATAHADSAIAAIRTSGHPTNLFQQLNRELYSNIPAALAGRVWHRAAEEE